MVLRNRIRRVALWIAVLGSFGTAFGLWYVVVQLLVPPFNTHVAIDPVLTSSENRHSLAVPSKSVQEVSSPMPSAEPLTPEQVVAAFDCARRQQSLPPFIRRPDLDAAAARLLERSAPLQSGDSGFTLTGQLILDTMQPTRACRIGGFNVAHVRDLERATTIGVAIAPLPDPGLVVAVVVGQ